MADKPQNGLLRREVAGLPVGPLVVADLAGSSSEVYTAGEHLTPQDGPGVLSFTFTDPVDLVWVRAVGGISFGDPFGGIPADGTGIYLADDEPTPVTVRTSEIKVWAPSGTRVYVWGFGP